MAKTCIIQYRRPYSMYRRCVDPRIMYAESKLRRGVAKLIGCDNYGHVWIADMCFDTGKGGIKLYLVDIESGELTALPEVNPLEAGETASTAAVRMDYCNVIGDITGVDEKAHFMASFNTDKLILVRALREQGSDEWVGDFDGYY